MATSTKTAKPATSTKTAPTKPTITDEQYRVLLATRLSTGKALEVAQADASTSEKDLAALKKANLDARSAVRKARIVRRNEAGLLEAAKQDAAAKKEARSKAARKAAETRAAKQNAPEGNGHRQAPEATVTETPAPAIAA